MGLGDTLEVERALGIDRKPPRKGGYILTFTGQQFWPLDPRQDEVCIEDIAHALSNMCRFTGHVRSFYSVAEHSVRVSWAMSPTASDATRLRALLHDASEAYLVDVPSPLKCTPEFAAYRDAEKTLQRTVFERFGVWWGDGRDADLVHEADLRMLATEKRDLMPEDAQLWTCLDNVCPYRNTIKPWRPLEAEFRFLELFAQLTGSGAW